MAGSPTAAARGLQPAAPASPCALGLITTRAGFDALEAEWNELFDHAGRGEQMFQTFNWLWHWAEHFLPPQAASLAVVTVRRDGRLVALMPLAVEFVAGLKQLVFMGDPVSQYGDALCAAMPDRSAVLGRALDFAITHTRADLVRLAKVRDDAMMAPVLAARAALTTGTEEAPFADLAKAGTLAGYTQRFSGKTLKNRRRQARRLEEHGAVALDWTLSGDAAGNAARTAMRLKRAWLKVRGQLSRAYADPRTDRFFAAVCDGTIRPAGARATLLTTGGEIANAAITVTCKGRQAVHVLAYSLKFEKCAAGVLHIERLVEQAYATGVTTLDLMAPRHDYKLEWTDGAIRVADYAVPVTLAGKAYTRFYLGFVRERMKVALKAAPAQFARPLALAQAALSGARAIRAASASVLDRSAKPSL